MSLNPRIDAGTLGSNPVAVAMRGSLAYGLKRTFTALKGLLSNLWFRVVLNRQVREKEYALQSTPLLDLETSSRRQQKIPGLCRPSSHAEELVTKPSTKLVGCSVGILLMI